MLQTSYNATEGRYPYKICPQKVPVKLLFEVLVPIASPPVYFGTITFNDRPLENIIAVKLNMLYVPENLGEAIPTSGRTKLLLSQRLGSLMRSNDFYTASSTTSGVLNSQAASNIIGYSFGGINPYPPMSFNTFDNNRIQWFNQPERIHSFDWAIVDIITGLQPNSSSEKNACFELEFYYACDCVKR